ncbi:MAG: H-NS histone family protein [bacterium]|nr:H-NS histone family protein [bacterium]
MSKEIENMSFEELQTEMASIQGRMTELREQKVDEVKQKIVELAASIGETPQSLFGLKQSTKRTAAPKFRHPSDPSMTWTGRGKPPNWIKELEEAGQNREEFLIEKPLV